MPSETIRVRENSNPGNEANHIFVLRNFKDQSDPSAVVDVTGYAFKLIVKRELTDTDAAALFDLTGAIESAADGKYRFTLTNAHTCFVPGSYPGEIRYWSGGAPGTGEQPDDAIQVTYVVEASVRLDEP